MEGCVPAIGLCSPTGAEDSSTAEESTEGLACVRLSLPAHLAFDRNKYTSDFDRPEEGFAVYAAFSEAALAFAAEGKLDAQQIGALNGLLKSTLDQELGNCVRATPQNRGANNRGNRKRQRGSGGAWCIKGSLVAYRREGRRVQIGVRRASLQTEGLVLPSDHLVISSLDAT